MQPSSYEMSKRKAFVERLRTIFPKLTESGICAMLERDSRTSFWVNPLRTASVDEVLHELTAAGITARRHDWMPNAFILDDESRRAELVASGAFAGGKIFVQNPSSYLPVLALHPQPGERILDMCAAPGGKSALIAVLSGNSAALWVNDKLPARVRKLREVLHLLGVAPKEFLQEPAEHLWKLQRLADSPFDKILLDAQCTGEGLVDFRKPNALEHWSLRRVEEYSYLQQRMLISAFKLLKPGGTLVYSTCTFSPDENEKPLSFLLDKFHGRVELLDFPCHSASFSSGLTQWMGQDFNPQLKLAVRVRPDGIMEGFFVCKLKRLGQGEAPVKKRKVRRRENAPRAGFQAENFAPPRAFD